MTTLFKWIKKDLKESPSRIKVIGCILTGTILVTLLVIFLLWSIPQVKWLGVIWTIFSSIVQFILGIMAWEWICEKRKEWEDA